MSKSMKRIHKVVIKRMIDDSPDSPDTSFLGEYGNKPESEYAIDREHDTDCPQQTYNRPTETIDQIERVIAYLNTLTYPGELTTEQYLAIEDAQELLIEKQDELVECTCGGRGRNTREYRYYNPPYENYAGLDKAEIVKYCIQDYERMESLNGQQWYFVGIRAEAEIAIPYATANKTGEGSTAIVQHITSGGLWGIESDSDAAYMKEVEQEQLSELRDQLHAIGFSTRAISAAFRDVREEN